ncbi:S8 family serine peptidase [uncultured Pseudokineococcus sp.]|uniref:S8 family serine peptidase n=1 Tax=uncultured Pseudokineococcus sp. TaxID=1642928 RepID=UPI00260E4981|nr:S8 family serine peptidase [uncultured Pseudokineococcus sp.]
MTHAHRRARRTAAAALALALTGAATATAVAGPASAAPPITRPAPGEGVMSYVVNTDATPAAVARVRVAVARAGGSTVVDYPEIGVVVARSANADFRDDVLAGHFSSLVDSVGPTRTVPVVEGVPGRWRGPGRGPQRPEMRDLLTGDASALGGAAALGVVDATAVDEPVEAVQWDMAAIGADEANAIEPGSPDVVVGVLDDGIDDSHPDLAGQVDRSLSGDCTGGGRFDGSEGAYLPFPGGYHGTHVAGTIAAKRDGQGVVGVAPGVTLAAVKVVSAEGFIYPESAICGFMHAAEEGFDVTNNSYYVDPWEFWCDDEVSQAAAREAVTRAVAYAESQGVVSAAAAGNSAYDLADKTTSSSSPNDGSGAIADRDVRGCVDMPTELPGVVTVSATQQDGARSTFSNYGVGVIDVAAPGTRVISTIPQSILPSGYAALSGTSMASPHVAGVLALLKTTHPDATPAELRALLEEQATDVPCPATPYAGQPCTGSPQDNGYFGEGLVDALAAVTVS